VAAAAATSSSWLAASGGSRDLEAQLAHLQDLNEIRGLNQAYLQHVSAGARDEMATLFADPRNATIDEGVRGISPSDFGERDEIEVAQDRQTATARLHVTAHTETAMDDDCTLVEMAKVQGEGMLRASGDVMLENTYVRRLGAWKILHSARRISG
jgi:hypothetical protein